MPGELQRARERQLKERSAFKNHIFLVWAPMFSEGTSKDCSSWLLVWNRECSAPLPMSQEHSSSFPHSLLHREIIYQPLSLTQCTHNALNNSCSLTRGNESGTSKTKEHQADALGLGLFVPDKLNWCPRWMPASWSKFKTKHVELDMGSAERWGLRVVHEVVDLPHGHSSHVDEKHEA